ncbi:MAG: hypothetical protein IJU51_06595 [Clostridia bacterium]|nr:hypothetical protein [Clostridia bacterium]
MSALVCKMCSAPLRVSADGKFAKCTYCGTVYTLPLEPENADAAEKAAPLMERAKMFLADGVFYSAGDYFEKVLDLLPSNGEAYLGKGLAELGVKKIADLRNIRREAKNNYFIKKALVFCDEPLLTELLSTLGIRQRTERVSRYLRQWRPGAMDVRKRFIQSLRRKIVDRCPEYEEESLEINRRYAADAANVKAQIASIDSNIAKEKARDTNTMTYEEVYNMAGVVKNLSMHRREYEKQLVDINNQLAGEILKLEEKYPEHRTSVSYADFREAADHYPLPPLPEDLEESLLEKVYDVLLSRYEYQSVEDLCMDRHLDGVSDKRMPALLKKLMFEKRAISVIIDGKEYYAPADLDGIYIE